MTSILEINAELNVIVEQFKSQFRKTPHVCEAWARRVAGENWEALLRLQILEVVSQRGQVVSIIPGPALEAELQEERN